ncbi:MAG: THUMP domain-containing protein, partial [Oscillospiraceae bacterium]
MKELILLKNGEIALKGLNRPTFEDKLIKNAKRRVKSAGDFKFYKAQSTIYCEPLNEQADIEQAFENLTYVFGFSALTRACIVKKEMQDIIEQSIIYLGPILKKAKTFKVEAKRSDKTFSLKSPQICLELGGKLLEIFPNLSVDVHTPDVVVKVEVRDFAAYVHAGQREGAGGMPIGTSGKAALLLSGGIDSPVAGYMMAKRGLEVQ